MTEKERGITIISEPDAKFNGDDHNGAYGRIEAGQLGPDIDGDVVMVDGELEYFNLSQGDPMPSGIDLTPYPTDADGDTAYPKGETGLRVAIVGGPGRHAFGLAAAAARILSTQGVEVVNIDSMGRIDVIKHQGQKINIDYQVVGGRIPDDLELMYPNIPTLMDISRHSTFIDKPIKAQGFPTPRVNKKTMHKRR